MELLQLKYFKSVAKHENITKAAKELHISQPSLSITIKRLEDELSVPLFTRKGKNISLNPYGELFLSHANSILNQIDNAKVEILELYGYRNTHLSLTATASIFLSGLLRDFLLLNPNITMTQTISQNTAEKLKDRSFDFAITSPPINDPMIETIELLEEEIVVVIPKSHKLAKKHNLYLKELKDVNFVELTDNFSFKSTTKTLFNNAGFEPNIIFQGDLSIISELFHVKQAVTLAPISTCIQSKNNTNYTISYLKDKNSTRKIAISYLKGIHLSDLAENFIKFTINYYKNSWFTLNNYPNTLPLKETFDTFNTFDK
ncbi:MAG: LysR family transcriptional regulator [Sarcina sp.]